MTTRTGWRRLGHAGLVSTETAILFVFVVAGLVGMAVYVQRSLQGQYFSGAQAIGLQFDPRDAYSESETLNNLTETTKQVVRSAMVSFEFRPLPCSNFDQSRVIDGAILWQIEGGDSKIACEESTIWESGASFRGFDMALTDPDRQLTSLPYGMVYREPTYTEMQVNTNWNVSRSASYSDAK